MDIVSHCRVPRYLHVDLPLGNPLGPPWQSDLHRQTIEQGLELAATALEPSIIESAIPWPGNPEWRAVYNRVDESNREELLRLGEANRRQRAANKAAGLTR